MAELKPCPFCGGESVVTKHHNRFTEKHKSERFSEEELERRFFSGEECEDFEQRRWPDGNDSSD